MEARSISPGWCLLPSVTLGPGVVQSARRRCRFSRPRLFGRPCLTCWAGSGRRTTDRVLGRGGRTGRTRPRALCWHPLPCARRLPGDERLALVGTYRSDELTRRHPLLPVFALGPERLPSVERIDLSPPRPRDAAPGPDRRASSERRRAPRLVEGQVSSAPTATRSSSKSCSRACPTPIIDGRCRRRSRRSCLRDCPGWPPEKTQNLLRIAAVIGRRAEHDLLASIPPRQTESRSRSTTILTPSTSTPRSGPDRWRPRLRFPPRARPGGRLRGSPADRTQRTPLRSSRKRSQSAAQTTDGTPVDCGAGPTGQAPRRSTRNGGLGSGRPAAAAVFAHDEALEISSEPSGSDPRRRPRVGDGEPTSIPVRQCGGLRFERRQCSTRDGARSLGGRGRAGSSPDPRRSPGAANRPARLVPLGAGRPGRRPYGRRRCPCGSRATSPGSGRRAFSPRGHVAVGDGPLSQIVRMADATIEAARRSGEVGIVGDSLLRRRRPPAYGLRGRHRRPPRGTCALPRCRRPPVRDRGQPA